MQARQPTSRTRLRRLPGRGACGRPGDRPSPSRPAASRAPRHTAVGPGARVRARDGDDPVRVEGLGLLAATVHPEPAGDPAVHGYLLNRIRPAGAAACKPASRRPKPA